jgi:hypothetical protein
MDRKTFIKRWAASIDLGSASIFIGAGLSRRAGYPDWRTLLKDIADELGLDINQESDLAAVAQYSLNRATGKRAKLSKLIVDHFPPKADAPEAFHILARLPIRHIWTTNYDTLAELAWRDGRKQLDVKSRNNDLGLDKPWANAILYKMHGSVDHPTEVVIAKDDYELYRRMRPGFLQVLTGQFVTKQFLFLGFSFTDPNISHLFASIREAFQENGPEHYAIVKRPQRGKGGGAKKRYDTEKTRHTLWVEDLQRYGIQCIEVDEHNEVDEILRSVELALARRSVFVSGSFPVHGPAKDGEFVEAVSRVVGRAIAKNGKRLVSGFGLTVGSAALAGALNVILEEPAPNLDKSLLLRPFPQEAPENIQMAHFRRRYRQGMIHQTGICVFIAGLKINDKGRTKIADGVLEEFEVAKAAGRVVVPIGCTGGTAKSIWKQMNNDRAYPIGLTKAEFGRLNATNCTARDVEKAIQKVMAAVDNDT